MAHGSNPNRPRRSGARTKEAAMRANLSTPSTSTLQDRDAVAGNERIARSAFILDAMRQEGCLASEAATRWDAGER